MRPKLLGQNVAWLRKGPEPPAAPVPGQKLLEQASVSLQTLRGEADSAGDARMTSVQL
jgi:hypothetical protein